MVILPEVIGNNRALPDRLVTENALGIPAPATGYLDELRQAYGQQNAAAVGIYSRRMSKSLEALTP